MQPVSSLASTHPCCISHSFVCFPSHVLPTSLMLPPLCQHSLKLHSSWFLYRVVMFTNGVTVGLL